MACKLSDDVTEVVSSELDDWLSCNDDGSIILLEISGENVDSCLVSLLIASEYEIKLHVPSGYPNNEDSFFIEAEPVIQTWTIAINEYLTDGNRKLSVGNVLDKAVQLFADRHKESESSEGEEMDNESEEEMIDETLDIDDEDAFTTRWDLEVAKKKIRWSKKEPIVREMMKKMRGKETSRKSQQIFTSNAALGILTNDLVKIMECEKTCGFSAEPIDDNIYHWKVRLKQFKEQSDLAKDLEEIMARHGYNYIEIEMMFEIDLFPFYPPLVKVLRPRLQGCMMQRITNIEFLQLSYWSPTKDMKSVIEGIKDFLQQWARTDVDHDRNDLTRSPYLDIEHHLLTLAQVSEITPRANEKYTLTKDKMEELKTTASVQMSRIGSNGNKEEYWAKGVGFGHGNRPGWDMDAYLAAQDEKDHKIEAALKQILQELKKLPTCEMSNSKSSSSGDEAGTSCMDMSLSSNGSGERANDMYSVIEGSVLIPFIEQHLKENSLLEISSHAVVYTVILSVLREIAYRRQLLPLLCWLDGQSLSLFQYLEQINDKATEMLKQISKPANGHIADQSSRLYHASSDSDSEIDCDSAHVPSMSCIQFFDNHNMQYRSLNKWINQSQDDSEEKLAREIGELFKLVKLCLEREELIGRCHCPLSNGDAAAGGDGLKKSASQKFYPIQEIQYKEKMKSLIFQSTNFTGNDKNHYYTKQAASQTTTKQQVIRIAQELSSLATDLPVNLSSSIFVRTDDNKIPLMQALITGPEGTPYSGGCFIFDIFFPNTYPVTPPKVNLRNTGHGTVRFNPNLYNCGMVCLSLLGTWQGNGGEQWNEKTSTILQVLVSIQSLILVPDPYFNEPGYEQSMNTSTGRKNSEEYNKNIQLNCINYAMLDLLKHPPAGFQDVIKTHFYLKKDLILQEVQGWAKKERCHQLESAVRSLKKELKNLTPPPAFESCV